MNLTIDKSRNETEREREIEKRIRSRRRKNIEIDFIHLCSVTMLPSNVKIRMKSECLHDKCENTYFLLIEAML